jgi:hypothetical protein
VASFRSFARVDTRWWASTRRHPTRRSTAASSSRTYISRTASTRSSPRRHFHHVADPAEVIDQVASVLASEGTLVVVELAWEDFDEPTARWCFSRLGPDDNAGWLHRRRDEWVGSAQEWDGFLRGWAEKARLHAGAALLRLLDERFDRRHVAREPYFFPDLAGASNAGRTDGNRRGRDSANPSRLRRDAPPRAIALRLPPAPDKGSHDA